MEDHLISEFSEKQRNAIINCTSAFLKKYFDFDAQHINVLGNGRMLVFRVEDFVSSAEIELAKRNRQLIDEMYSRVFYRVIGPFIQPIQLELRKKVVSCRMQADIETRACIITVSLSSKKD